MAIMKEQTTCGRREMRALMRGREVSVATPETESSRTRRDHGNAPWGAKLTEAAKVLPRKIRRALSGVRKVGDMETLVAMETLLRVKGTR